jgi:hypothetical protein
MKHLLLSSVLFVAACSSASGRDGHGGGGGSNGGGGGSNGGGGGSNGGGGGSNGGGGGSNGGGGGSNDDCSGAAKLIYVVDENETLYSFTPNQTDITQSVFATIGKMACPNTTNFQAFSMAVDREANAWVELQNPGNGLFTPPSPSEVFKVSTTNASCAATSFTAGQGGFDEFGMGFAANASMSTAETLYVVGGAILDGTGSGTTTSLGSLDTSSLGITTLAGNITGSPELTGTGLGDLWGFFPDLSTLGGSSSTPYIGQIDKATGAISGQIMLPTLPSGASAWAFAFYGGDFFIFLSTTGNTVVYQVSNGALKTATLKTDKKIVGAGVSTCAPVIPIS